MGFATDACFKHVKRVEMKFDAELFDFTVVMQTAVVHNKQPKRAD